MAKRLAELGALQDAVSNDESSPKRLALAGYIRGLFLDWSANPYNPLSRLTARGRLLGYFWDSGAIGLSMNFADQNYLVKDGTVQSKSFSQIVNFSRTTNATVTNSAGQITYAPHNLLTYSEQFDNAAWIKTSSSVTANNTVAPNGTTTADLYIPAAISADHFIYQSPSLTAVSHTFTVYAKAGGYPILKIAIGVPGTPTVNFNLSTGAIGTTSGSSTSSITSIGNGWYRCSVGFTGISGSVVLVIRAGDADNFSNTFTGDGVSGAYLWGAQLEIGSTATTYNSTTVKNLLGYSELFDNAAWTKSNSFVQTNLLTYSEAFDNAAWNKDNSGAINPVVTANAGIAPNGYQTADRIVFNKTGGVFSRIFQAPISTSGITYTFSVWLKSAIGSNVNLGIRLDATGLNCLVTSEWQRFTISTAATGATIAAQILLFDSIIGNDETADVYVWGAQLVQGSVAGDYRRTDAAALPVYYPNHNGVVCAEKWVEGKSTFSKLAINTASGAQTGKYTISMYAKKGERTQIAIGMSDNAIGETYAIADLAAGTVASPVSAASWTGATASINLIANDWYRISLTAFKSNASANITGIGYIVNGGAISYTGDGTSGIYIFGAQLSDSASLDPYVLNAAAAPTAAAYYGARFDYDPITLQPKGLLIEEQRTNLLLNSSLSGTNLATQSVTVTAQAYTLSFYGTGSVVLSGTAIATVNGTGAYPTRTTYTFTPTAGAVLFTVTGTVQYAQLEAGSFATSFIPTAASQVTRAADVATIQGSNFYSWFNQNEGSVAAQFTFSQVAGFPSPFSIDGGTSLGSISTNRIQFYQNTNSTALGFDVFTLGAGQVNITFTGLNLTTNTKVVGAYKVNDFSAAVNNLLGTPDTSGITAIYDRLIIGRASPVPTATCIVKSISYYPQRLSDSVLKGLTA